MNAVTHAFTKLRVLQSQEKLCPSIKTSNTTSFMPFETPNKIHRWRGKTMLKIALKRPESTWQLAHILLVLRFHTYTFYTPTDIKEHV